mmetsp:Transcript_134827/g.375756  ORF Transcript_134827/g.375756 Transcript_134827/m.375756 type:complete len:209 (-) Transcript_134827:1457-2083(-)
MRTSPRYACHRIVALSIGSFRTGTSARASHSELSSADSATASESRFALAPGLLVVVSVSSSAVAFGSSLTASGSCCAVAFGSPPVASGPPSAAALGSSPSSIRAATSGREPQSSTQPIGELPSCAIGVPCLNRAKSKASALRACRRCMAKSAAISGPPAWRDVGRTPQSRKKWEKRAVCGQPSGTSCTQGPLPSKPRPSIQRKCAELQ